MSKYSAYLEKMAKIRSQARAAQVAFDNQCPPSIIDEGMPHPRNCKCPECAEERASYGYYESRDERED